MSAVPTISAGAAVPAGSQRIAPKPIPALQVNPKAIELFCASILEDLKPWNDAVDTCYEFAKKAAYDRKLAPPRLELPFSPRPCQEERDFKSDLEDLMRYPDLVGWPETNDRRLQAQCSAYQLAYHNAFKKAGAVFPHDTFPLVCLTDLWENKPEKERFQQLHAMGRRITIGPYAMDLTPDSAKKLIFMTLHPLLKLLDVTAEEHTAFLVLTIELRKEIKKTYDIVPLDAIKA
ncbi:MAG TPA: hypothetical protein VLG44_08650 [Chlamydiales bacterium]|nr:hypothetical protein [Chlamydiales bacterium]